MADKSSTKYLNVPTDIFEDFNTEMQAHAKRIGVDKLTYGQFMQILLHKWKQQSSSPQYAPPLPNNDTAAVRGLAQLPGAPTRLKESEQ